MASGYVYGYVEGGKVTGQETHDLLRHTADMGALSVFCGAVAYVVGKFVDGFFK